MRRLVLIVLVLGACGRESIDTAGLPSTAGYTTWWVSEPQIAKIPGHGDTYRLTYVNDVGRIYPHGGRYATGTVIVKDIYDKNDDDSQGGFRYTAIMRKVGEDAAVSPPVEGGWVFSKTDTQGGTDEEHLDTCWATCHIQAPWDGAWRDYGE